MSSSTKEAFISKSRNESKSIMKVKTLKDSLTSPDNCAGKSNGINRLVRVESPSSVTFNHVAVREYALVIGDNPSCSEGAPLR